MNTTCIKCGAPIRRNERATEVRAARFGAPNTWHDGSVSGPHICADGRSYHHPGHVEWEHDVPCFGECVVREDESLARGETTDPRTPETTPDDRVAELRRRAFDSYSACFEHAGHQDEITRRALRAEKEAFLVALAIVTGNGVDAIAEEFDDKLGASS